jgi:hypothetical protein
MKMEQNTPKRWHLNYKRRRITQKKAYDKVRVAEGHKIITSIQGSNFRLI